MLPLERDSLREAAPTYSAISVDDDGSTKIDNSDGTLENAGYGYFLLFCSSFIFCTMFLFMRWATAYNSVDISSVVILRGLTQISLATATSFAFLDTRKVFYVPEDTMPLLAARAAFASFSMTLSSISVSLIPLSLETTLFFTNPIFTMILSAIFLAEPLGIREAISACLSMVGVSLVSNPTLSFGGSISTTYAWGIGAVLCSAMLVAVANVAIRSLGMRVHFMANVMAIGVCETLTGAAMGGITSTLSLRNNWAGFAVTLAAGVCGFLAECLFANGMQHCRAGTGSVIRTVSVPLSYLMGLLVLGETSNLVAIAGSCFVLSGMLVIGWDLAGDNENEENDALKNPDAGVLILE